MGTRYITKKIEWEITGQDGCGIPVEVHATFWYDTDELEIEYAYNLQAAKYIDESELSNKDREDIINQLCVHGDYYELEA